MRFSYTILKNSFKSFSVALLSLFFVLGINYNVMGQLSISSNFANNNGSSVVIFTFYNGNPYSIDINSIGTFAGTTGTQTAQFWTKSVTGFGQATTAAVNATNGWTLQSTQSVATTANTTGTVGATAPLVLSGMAVPIPANSYYLFCVSLSSIRYSTLGTQTGTFTSNGCDINCTASNGFGGTLASPSNTPRGFIGVINFSPSFIPTPIDLGVTTFIKPLSTKNCFSVDTIIARVQNYGSTVMNFSATPAVLTVSVTGAASNTFTLAINTGTLGLFATRDYTVSTNYNMATVGTFNFKAYTTVSGDGNASNDTITKSVNKIITPTPNLGNDSLYCNLPIIINSNAIANSYLWNNGSIGSNLNITSSGKYWVRATNSNGCVMSDTILISLGSSPIVTLGSDTSYCQGSTINLYAGFGSGNSYLWSNGSTASSISVGSNGTYSVVVTNTIGCKSSDTINVTSKSKPSVSLVFGGQTSFCPTDLTGRLLTEGTPSGGTYIGGGVTGNSFFPNQATQGTHIIIYNYTAPNGCSNTAKDTLRVNACVGVEELSDNLGLNVYPNPNSGVFTLEINSSSDIDGNVHLMSIDGKLIYTEMISGNGLITKSINISDLADGIYYLRIETKTTIKTYKVLKQ